jgi:DNA-binding transcriptional MerR regulator
MLTKGEVSEAAGIPETTLQGWIQRGIIVPAVAGRIGPGGGTLFTFMQSVGIAIAEQLRKAARGCSVDYVGAVAEAFGAMDEAELRRKLAEGDTHLVMIHQGRPLLRCGAGYDWPDVGAAVEALDSRCAAAARG